MRAFLCLTLLAVALAVPRVTTSVENGYYEDRSADIIVRKFGLQQADEMTLFVSGNIVQSWSSKNSLVETSLADLVGNMVGAPIINVNTPREDLPVVSMFKKAAANVLVVVDGISSGEAQQLDITSTPGFFRPVQRSSYPEDAVATAASMATGHTPSVHGIVNKEWFTSSGMQQAYKMGALPKIPAFSDVVFQASEGQSNVLSASADYQMAAAFGVHYFLQAQTRSSAASGFAWDAETERFYNLYTNESVMEYSSVISRIVDFANSHQSYASFDFETMILTVGEVHFNLNIKENFAFFTELVGIRAVVEEALASRKPTSSPDLYNLVFTTLKAARLANNEKRNQALTKILDRVISELVAKVNTVYNDQVAVEYVFIGGNELEQLADDHQSAVMAYYGVNHIVSSYRLFMKYYPQIYVVQKRALTQEFCAALQSGMPDDYQVQCPGLSHRSLKRQLFPFDDDPNNGTEFDNTEAALFHILLWFNIILVILAFFAVLSIATMDVGADSLLYRMTSTIRR